MKGGRGRERRIRCVRRRRGERMRGKEKGMRKEGGRKSWGIEVEERNRKKGGG